jgi:transposase
MSKVFRPYAPEQSELLPPSPREWLPEGHMAYFILDTVAQLDLRPLLARYERELRGYPPHHPRIMVGLLLYAYCVGVASSRRIEKKTYEDIAFRVIAAGQHPDHSTVSEFRRQHLDVLAGLFAQVLALCQKAGLVKLGHVALDGTKLKANASKHKAMSYERMQQREKELAQKVAELLKAAEEADAAEDQAAMDEEHQIIVAQALTNQPPDVEHWLPLLERVVENCGEVPQVVTADAGYFSEENLTRVASMGIEVYVATGRAKHGEQPAPVRGQMPKDLSLKEWMARRLRTQEGRAVYSRRKAVAEPPFGQIKQVRGFRQLLLRRLEKARGEWALICLTHNLLKLHRARAAA